MSRINSYDRLKLTINLINLAKTEKHGPESLRGKKS